jgi:alpha-L-fucosidase
MEIGPKKDICGMWKSAAKNHGLPFGLTEHLGATFWWWGVNKNADTYGKYKGVPYDGNNPEYRDFYLDNHEHSDLSVWKWYTENPKWHEYWLRVVKEVIDIYEPDLLYTDGGLPFNYEWNEHGTEKDEYFRFGLEAVSYLYNKSIEKYGENLAVYTQKNRNPDVFKVGVLDIEKSQLPGIQEDLWHTDTCIGNWFYDAKQTYKKPWHIIEMLVDIISKNGVMLLNILQRPDGTIGDEGEWILDEMACWYDVCGEAVFGARPWRVYGEGSSSVVINGFAEDRVQWQESDYRFVAKGDDTLYAFIMQTPQNRVCVIKNLTEKERVANVELLGHGKVGWSQQYGVLTVQLPNNMPLDYVNCLKIQSNHC